TTPWRARGWSAPAPVGRSGSVQRCARTAPCGALPRPYSSRALTTAGFLKGVLATSLVVLGFCSANAVANRFLEQRDELRLPLGSSEREKLAEYGAHADE